MATEVPGEDIAAWQANWNVPKETLDEVVRCATGSGPRSNERILEGHENEVHDVVTRDGQRVIVRVAWRPGRAFERERWPMEAARRVGIPVPEILLIEHTTLDDVAVSFNVQQWMPGLPIHRLRSRATDDELSRLTREAGRLLASLHTIEPSGRGPIGPDGAVDLTLADDRTAGDDLIERTAWLVGNGVDRVMAEQALAVVMGNASLLDAAPVRLTHGDWTVANLLAEGDSITAVVDWGGGGGDPASEFKGWDFWSNYGPTALHILLAGYIDGGGTVDEDFERRRLLHRIANMQDAMSHFIGTSRPDLLAKAIGDLQSALEAARGLL